MIKKMEEHYKQVANNYVGYLKDLLIKREKL
jgi:hypothetical protein